MGKVPSSFRHLFDITRLTRERFKECRAGSERLSHGGKNPIFWQREFRGPEGKRTWRGQLDSGRSERESGSRAGRSSFRVSQTPGWREESAISGGSRGKQKGIRWVWVGRGYKRLVGHSGDGHCPSSLLFPACTSSQSSSVCWEYGTASPASMSEIPALLSPILCFHPTWAEVASSSPPHTYYCSLSILPQAAEETREETSARGLSGSGAYSGEGRLGMGWRGKGKCQNSLSDSCRRTRDLRVTAQTFPVGRVLGRLLRMKTLVFIASTAEGAGRHGPPEDI